MPPCLLTLVATDCQNFLIRFYKKLVIARKHSDCAFPFSVNIFCQILEAFDMFIILTYEWVEMLFCAAEILLIWSCYPWERMYIERLWLYRVFCPFFHLSNAVTDCAIFASRRWSAIGSWLFDDFITQLSRYPWWGAGIKMRTDLARYDRYLPYQCFPVNDSSSRVHNLSIWLLRCEAGSLAPDNCPGVWVGGAGCVNIDSVPRSSSGS